MPGPTFSVIMPAYNAERTIASAVCSVLRQSRADFELIVVDDGSTDETRALVADVDDPRVRLVARANGGPAAARNDGIAVARGRYLSMLDSDDMWMPHYLETMSAALEAAPSAAFAYTDAWVLDDETGRIRATTAMSHHRPPVAPPAESERFLLLLVDRNFIFTSVTVRRAVIDALGGYDERLWYGEDFELWVRIVAAGHPVARAEDVLVIHRDRADSLTSDTARLYAGVCRAYDLIGEKIDLEPAPRAVLDARRAYWERQLRAIEDPSALDRLRGLARRVKRRLVGNKAWLDAPPPLVADTLRACCLPETTA